MGGILLRDISIETLRKCPNYCVHCSSLSDRFCQEILPYDVFSSAVGDAAELGTTQICISGGEPFLHPDLITMVDLINSLGLGIWTEAHFVPMRLNIDQIKQAFQLCMELGMKRVSFLRLVLQGRALDNAKEIAAFGPRNRPTEEKLVCLMQVSETLTFDEYWNDPRFKLKRPVFNRSTTRKYGDNIYHHVNGVWVQEPSHHSFRDGMNPINLNRDTQTDRVLIAEKFYYFGEEAILLPTEYQSLVWHNRNHGVSHDSALIESFVSYIRGQYSSGIHGLPFSRKPGKFDLYGG